MRIESTPQTTANWIPAEQRTGAQEEASAARADQTELLLPDRLQEAGGDLRADRIAQARQRLKSGFYHRPEIKEQIADAFLNAILPKTA